MPRALRIAVRTSAPPAGPYALRRRASCMSWALGKDVRQGRQARLARERSREAVDSARERVNICEPRPEASCAPAVPTVSANRQLSPATQRCRGAARVTSETRSGRDARLRGRTGTKAAYSAEQRGVVAGGDGAPTPLHRCRDSTPVAAHRRTPATPTKPTAPQEREPLASDHAQYPLYSSDSNDAARTRLATRHAARGAAGPVCSFIPFPPCYSLACRRLGASRARERHEISLERGSLESGSFGPGRLGPGSFGFGSMGLDSMGLDSWTLGPGGLRLLGIKAPRVKVLRVRALEVRALEVRALEVRAIGVGAIGSAALGAGSWRRVGHARRAALERRAPAFGGSRRQNGYHDIRS